MENNIANLIVTALDENGNYHVMNNETREPGIVFANDISLRGPGKRPVFHIGKTVDAYCCDGDLNGYPLYSCRAYEESVYQNMRADFDRKIRNVYTGKLVFIDPEGRYTLWEVAQGILGSLGMNNLCMTQMQSNTALRLKLGLELPLTITAMSADYKINLNAAPGFGSFEKGVEMLGLREGKTTCGLVVSTLPANNDQYVVMLSPNVSCLIDVRPDIRVGMTVELFIRRIDYTRRKVSANALQPVTEPLCMNLQDYVVNTDVTWIDVEAFVEANRVRKKMIQEPTNYESAMHASAATNVPPMTSAFEPMCVPKVDKMPPERAVHTEKKVSSPNIECMEVKAEFRLSHPDRFAVSDNERVVLKPPSYRYLSLASFQVALQEGRIDDNGVRVAVAVDTLEYATNTQVAEFISLIKCENKKDILKNLKKIMADLVDLNVLAELTIEGGAGGPLTVFFRGRHYHHIIHTEKNHRLLPYTGMPSEVVKHRLSANGCMLGYAHNNLQRLRFYKANLQMPGTKLDPKYLKIPYKLSFYDGIVYIDSVRSGGTSQLQQRLQQYNCRLDAGDTVMIAVENKEMLYDLTNRIKRKMKLNFQVALTTDNNAYASHVPLIAIHAATKQTPLSKVMNVLRTAVNS